MTTACPPPITAGAAYAQARLGDEAALSGPTSPVSRAAGVALPADPEAATAAAIAVTATAPAASAVRLSRLAGWPTPAIAPSSDRRRPGGVRRGARSAPVGRDVCLRVPFM